MKELEDLILKSFAAMQASGAIEKIVTEQITKTVQEILSNSLRSSSQFGKDLEAAVKEGLKVDFRDIGFAGYNQIILKIVKDKLDASVHRHANEAFAEQLAALLQDPPKEIKLSELFSEFKTRVREDASREDIEITCEVKTSRGSCAGYKSIEFHQEKDSTYSGKTWSVSVTKDGEVYSISTPYHGDITKRVYLGNHYGFEQRLFQLWAAKSKLIVDLDEGENHS